MRYKCIVSYDGTNFHGFQTQQDLRTVQKEIEDVLFKIMNTCGKVGYNNMNFAVMEREE